MLARRRRRITAQAALLADLATDLAARRADFERDQQALRRDITGLEQANVARDLKLGEVGSTVADLHDRITRLPAALSEDALGAIVERVAAIEDVLAKHFGINPTNERQP